MKPAALFFLALSSLALSAQTIDRKPTPPPSADPQATLPTQKIGPDDLLSIAVADCPELTRNFRVRADGSLPLPLISVRIQATGKYPDEIEGELSEALVKDQILVHPVVSVAVAEYRSVPVSVVGAVRHPITFQAVGDITLLDALARAEGLNADAGAEILISRSHAAAGGQDQQLVQRIPVQGLIDQADPTLNIRLYGGEEVRVPLAGRIYVLGNVKRSGAFPVSENNDTTVLKAIALSEGLLPYAGKEAFIYRHEAAKNDRSEIPIQLSQIMDRKAPDVHLQPNDILYIPDAKGRRMTAQALERIAGFGITTASGLLIFK